MTPLILAVALAAAPLGGFPDYVRGVERTGWADCETETGLSVNFIVQVRFGRDGRLIIDPFVTSHGDGDPEATAAAEVRTLKALKAAPPVADLPDNMVDLPIAIGFRASRSCQ